MPAAEARAKPHPQVTTSSAGLTEGARSRARTATLAPANTQAPRNHADIVATARRESGCSSGSRRSSRRPRAISQLSTGGV
jgi:hypothetical protein